MSDEALLREIAEQNEKLQEEINAIRSQEPQWWQALLRRVFGRLG